MTEDSMCGHVTRYQKLVSEVSVTYAGVYPAEARWPVAVGEAGIAPGAGLPCKEVKHAELQTRRPTERDYYP